MHEMSIALSLVEQLQRLAEQHHATSISELEVQCGVMRQVVPEALELAFTAAAMETIAAGATLKIIEEPLVVRCRQCGTEFAAEIDDYACSGCKLADVEILAGRDIVLKSVTCETEDR